MAFVHTYYFFRMANKFKYSVEDLASALKDTKLSINKAAVKYGIPKTNLSIKLSGKSRLVRKMGPSSFLNYDEESKIKTWVLNNAKLGFPLNENDVKDSVQKVIKYVPRVTSFKDSRPGKKWMNLFLKRNPGIV